MRCTLVAAFVVYFLSGVPVASGQTPTDAGTQEPGAEDATNQPAPAARKLRVAIAGSQPFVVDRGSVPTGLSVDVWEATAADLGVASDYQVYQEVSEAIEAVASGQADVAVGPISITAERARKVEFTQPYFAASAGIMAVTTPTSAWARFKPIFTGAFLAGLALLVVILFGVGNLMWLAERKKNADQFPTSWLRGAGTGAWFALVTMTTVGYGDKVPITRAGRLVASAWMLIAMFAVSTITAGIATALTLSQIETAGITDLASLQRRQVLAVDGTPGEKLAKRYGARVVMVEDKERALELMEQEEADALLYDYPVLRYYLSQNPDSDLAVYESAVLSDNYGFAAAPDSPLIEKMNIALLNLKESGTMQSIADQWLPGR